MAIHPYKNFPATSFWRSAVGGIRPADFDPIVSADIRLHPNDKICTAGSCFAQHIARHLRNGGFNFYVTEAAHPIIKERDALEHNYGVFSARYGNIYTARQLLQLIQRVYGEFRPFDNMWARDDGRFVDPFRPQISPTGYFTVQEFMADRRYHFKCVRQAFENLDYFVFTLGLTECWGSRDDGAVYPLCPGVAGGTFDPNKHEFHNFGVAETVADLSEFIRLLRHVNATAKIILTVSPVPLIATATNEHVLVATTYSKSVLRVACDELCRREDGVTYFPSYEIITGNYNRGDYFAEDLRSITEDGVKHVMRTFFKHFCDVSVVEPVSSSPSTPAHDAHMLELQRAVAVICDEEMLEK